LIAIQRPVRREFPTAQNFIRGFINFENQRHIAL